MKINRKQKIAAGLVALSVLMATPAYAADTINTTSEIDQQGTGSLFSDVSSQHWAIKHITKLAALGIIQGYEKNEYRPENSVSQQEVIVMAIRMMGLESEALKNKSDIILPVAVDSFFKPYIAYAFDRGLLDINEETAASSAASKTAWGGRSATREWVAKLVIRTIGKQGLADEKAGAVTIFMDQNEMSEWAIGYINAAASLNIVNGVDGNNFQPKGAVTRAQMATFLSRADKELTTRSNRVASGYVMGLNNGKLSIQDIYGVTGEYTINSKTVIYNGKDDSRIASSALKETYEVYVIQTQGVASYIELINDQEQMGSIEGTLNQLFLNQMQLAINQGGGVDLKELASNVTATDANGRGLSLNSIPAGSLIELKWNLLIPNSKITQIIVKQVPISKTAEGTIMSIQKEQNTITFQEATTGTNETYPLGAIVPVKLADETASDVSKLRVGDVVAYDIKANQITGISIRKQADVTNAVQGTLMSISDDKKSMTINIAGKSLGAYFIAENAIVNIDGLTNAGLYDIVVGDELKLELLNERIVKVNVTNRSIKQMAFANIINYDADSKLLTGTYENGDPFAFKLTDTTLIKYNYRTVALDSFASEFQKGTKIDLTVSKDKVLNITRSELLEGTVTQVSASTNEIGLRTVSGQNITFRVPDGIGVSFWANGYGKLSDLKVGELISARLDSSQLQIVQVSVKKSAVYKILMANPDTRQVNAEDENGSLFTFKIDTNDMIINANGGSHNFSDILQDDYLKVSYTGNLITSATILQTVRGKISSIDTTEGTVTIQDLSNSVKVVPVGQKFVIKQGGVSSATLTNLKPDDRVELISDPSEKSIITVATASKRTVSSYDSVLNQLVFKPTANGDRTNYNFYAKAYFHKGMNIVAPNAFVDGEEVTIYTLGTKIIEVEK